MISGYERWLTEVCEQEYNKDAKEFGRALSEYEGV